MPLISRFEKIAAASFFILSLASCAMFSGRETAGEYVDDTVITSKVKSAFISDPVVKAMQVNVETMKGVVQLSGFVDSKTAEDRAVELAQGVNGVKAVRNDIIVRNPPNP